MNTPEMKYRGSIVAWVMGWAESWLRITEARAKPRQQKASAPTITVTTRARRRPFRCPECGEPVTV